MLVAEQSRGVDPTHTSTHNLSVYPSNHYQHTSIHILAYARALTLAVILFKFTGTVGHLYEDKNCLENVKHMCFWFAKVTY